MTSQTNCASVLLILWAVIPALGEDSSALGRGIQPLRGNPTRHAAQASARTAFE